MLFHGPLTGYVKLRVAREPGMPGTFSPPPRVSDPDMHHNTCVTHAPWCMARSLTSGFLWIRRRGKRSQHSRRMRNQQFYGSCKRPMPRCHRLNLLERSFSNDAGVNKRHVNGLEHGCGISMANALEILQSCNKPSIWSLAMDFNLTLFADFSA